MINNRNAYNVVLEQISNMHNGKSLSKENLAKIAGILGVKSDYFGLVSPSKEKIGAQVKVFLKAGADEGWTTFDRDREKLTKIAECFDLNVNEVISEKDREELEYVAKRDEEMSITANDEVEDMFDTPGTRLYQLALQTEKHESGSKALSLLEKAADAGLPEAMERLKVVNNMIKELGPLTPYQIRKVIRNPKSARQKIERARSLYDSVKKLESRGIDTNEALKNIQKAADLGDSKAVNVLRVLYELNSKIREIDSSTPTERDDPFEYVYPLNFALGRCVELIDSGETDIVDKLFFELVTHKLEYTAGDIAMMSDHLTSPPFDGATASAVEELSREFDELVGNAPSQEDMKKFEAFLIQLNQFRTKLPPFQELLGISDFSDYAKEVAKKAPIVASLFPYEDYASIMPNGSPTLEEWSQTLDDEYVNLKNVDEDLDKITALTDKHGIDENQKAENPLGNALDAIHVIRKNIEQFIKKSETSPEAREAAMQLLKHNRSEIQTILKTLAKELENIDTKPKDGKKESMEESLSYNAARLRRLIEPLNSDFRALQTPRAS